MKIIWYSFIIIGNAEITVGGFLLANTFYKLGLSLIISGVIVNKVARSGIIRFEKNNQKNESLFVGGEVNY